MDSQRIDITKLRTFIDSALKELEERVAKGVRLRQDMYWEVPIQEQFDVKDPFSPPSLVVGSLSDDLRFISTAMNAGREALPTALFHASALLSYLALHAQDD
jgi:hypothetical protein